MLDPDNDVETCVMALSTVVKRCQVLFVGDVYLLVTYTVSRSGLCVVMKIFLRFSCFKSSWKLVVNKVYAEYW